MLPTHVFADVVGCLALYNLDALLLTDARCSDLAHSAASTIRVFDFSEFQFTIYPNRIFLYKPTANSATDLEFLDNADLVAFIPDALRNCVFGNLTLCYKGSYGAVSKVAHTIVVKGTLCLYAFTFENMHAMVQFAVTFRSVQVLSPPPPKCDLIGD